MICWVLGSAVVAAAVLLIVVVWWSLPKRQRFSVREQHAFITGGSKGIGRELAAELLRRGARTVSIAARDMGSLKKAQEHLQKLCKDGQTVEIYQLDVTADFAIISNVLNTAEEKSGPVDLLINNAGFVVQGDFTEIPPESFLNQMKINYVGGALVTRAVVEGMKRRQRGHVVFVSSAAGQCAIWGYTAYSPSKFAVRGFADALMAELRPFNVGVSVLYPPNTDTEGFAVEKEEMPEQIRLIGDAAGLASAADVAKEAISGVEAGNFAITIGLEGWMLGTVCAGASPEPNLLAAFAQSAISGLLRAVMLIYLGSFDRIVQRIHSEREKTNNES